MGTKIIKGINDVMTVKPEFKDEWDFEKNKNIDIYSLGVYSKKRVWWKCKKCGYEWESNISTRTNGGGNCRKCKNEGKYLLDVKPELKDEWDYVKNKDIDINNITYGSAIEVFWLCKYGHSYKCRINHRVYGVGCGICAKGRKTSYPEQFIYLHLKELFEDVKNQYKIGKYSIDIFIPSINLAIEYDGKVWHNTEVSNNRDKNKEKYLKENNIDLLRVREDTNLKSLNVEESIIYTNPNKRKMLKAVVCEIITYIKKNYGLSKKYKEIEDLDKKINERIQIYREENLLIDKFPELINDLHPTKNGRLKPEFITVGSNLEVYWLCDKGHTYKTMVKNRVRGYNCNICSGRKLEIGTNDLKTINPKLAKEWNTRLNGELKPTQVTSCSNKKVWWLCSKCGHEWDAIINNRNSKNRGCPLCVNQVIVKGINDLGTINPEVAKDWHPNLNKDLSPSEVGAGSPKKVWWKCSKCGYEYESNINKRVRDSGKKCKQCGK